MGVVGYLAALWLTRFRYPWSHLRQRLCEWRYLKKELPTAKSLPEIRAHLKEVKWTADGFFHLWDAISYPQTVWAKKKDDCDGFSVLAAELIERLDPKLKPVLISAAVRPLKRSHTVCAFRDGQRFAFFDNARLRQGDYQSYADIVKKCTGERSAKLLCWDVVKPKTYRMLEFHRV